MKEILIKEMTRKEFLQFAGMAVIALFGLNNFINFIRSQLTSTVNTTTVTNQSKGHGFGSSKFGV